MGIVRARTVVRGGATIVVASLLALSGCRSSRARECQSLVDVDARLSRDVHTYPDAKTTTEQAQNWIDDSAKLQAEHDALERLTFHDERLSQWASAWRDALPMHARVARHLAEALRAEDWPTARDLQREWETRQRTLKGVAEDLEAYCATR